MRSPRYEIQLTRLSDNRWQWQFRQAGWIVTSGSASSEAFAFCAAVRSIMDNRQYKDEVGILSNQPREG